MSHDEMEVRTKLPPTHPFANIRIQRLRSRPLKMTASIDSTAKQCGIVQHNTEIYNSRHQFAQSVRMTMTL